MIDHVRVLDSLYATASYTLYCNTMSLFQSNQAHSQNMCEEKSVHVDCTQIHTEGMISQEMWLALNDLTIGEQDTVSRSGPYY